MSKSVKQIDTKMPFGKHKGDLICDLPDQYLEWLLDQEFVEDDWPNIYEQLKIECEYRCKFGSHT